MLQVPLSPKLTHVTIDVCQRQDTHVLTFRDQRPVTLKRDNMWSQVIESLFSFSVADYISPQVDGE